MKEITEQMLTELRESVQSKMSPKRFRHTAAVEEMIARLCALYCPAQTPLMRAAALLHDVTKELSCEEQEQLCHTFGLRVTALDHISPKTYHARTAAALIPCVFPAFDDPIILQAVRWHTTGHGGMTLTEKLLYLADYIDDSRTYPTCVTLRNFFFDAAPQNMDRAERLAHLDKTMLLSFDFTIQDLLEEGKPIAADTVNARNALLRAQAKA